MRDEHKIIMSSYYQMSSTALSKLGAGDYIYSVSIDVEQMLYMMGGVFGQIEYKYYIEDGRTKIKPVGEKSEEYNKLVDRSNEVLAKNGVLAVDKGGEEGFSEQDYRNIEKYKHDDMSAQRAEPKAILYFMTVLTNRLNSTGRVNTRENVSYYCLFTYKNGNEFIGYLIAVLLRLLITCRDGRNDKSEKVINSLNNDFESMQRYYDGAGKILEALKTRNTAIQNDYEQNFFKNSSDMLIEWILKHQEILEEGDILKFIFRGNKEYGCKANMRFANNLLRHIVQISRLMLHMKSGSIKWEEKLQEKDRLSDFQCLDTLINKLEEGGDNPSFDKNDWIKEYIRGLSMVVDEKYPRVAG